MGLVGAEFFGSAAGLGASISYDGGFLKTTNMLAYLVVVAALSILLVQGLSIVEGHFDSWRTGPGK